MSRPVVVTGLVVGVHCAQAAVLALNYNRDDVTVKLVNDSATVSLYSDKAVIVQWT